MVRGEVWGEVQWSLLLAVLASEKNISKSLRCPGSEIDLCPEMVCPDGSCRKFVRTLMHGFTKPEPSLSVACYADPDLCSPIGKLGPPAGCRVKRLACPKGGYGQGLF